MPQIQSGESFVTGQQFTAVRANNHVNGAVLLPGAVSEQASGAAVIAASANPSTEVDLLGRSTSTGQLVKVNIQDLTYNLEGLTINGILTANTEVANHTISGPSLFIASVPGGSEAFLSINTGGYEAITYDNSHLSGTQVLASDTGVYSVEASEAISLSAPSIYTGNSEVKIGQTGKIMYEDPLVAGTYIDITQNIKDKRRLYDVVINEVNRLEIPGTSGNRYSSGVPYPTGWNAMLASSASDRYTFTYVVPAGEKWIVELEPSADFSTDDAWGVAWLVNDVVVKGFIYNFVTDWTPGSTFGSWSTGIYQDNIKFRRVFTEGTYTLKIKAAFFGGSGGDLIIFGGDYGNMIPPHQRKWQEIIHKFKI